MKSIRSNSRLIDAAALQRASNRSKAMSLLSSPKEKMSGKLRRALRFLTGREVPVGRAQPKPPLLRLEQQLRGKTASQLCTRYRRELKKIKAEKCRAEKYKDKEKIVADIMISIRFLESRSRLIAIELRRRGVISVED